MQLCAAQAIQLQWPDAEVVISSPFPQLDESFYAPTKVEKSDRRRLILATFRVAASWVLKRWLRLPDRILARLPLGAETRSFLNSDLIVDLSGDMLTEDYGVIVGYSHLLPLMLARALRRPYALCAQSIGPIRYLRRFLQPILREATFVTVRERISLKQVVEIEPKARLSVTADLAFLLRPCPEKRLRVLLEEQGISQKRQTRIGISVSALLATKFAKAHSKSYVDFMAELCNEIRDSFDAEVILIPHVFGPRADSDDRETIVQVASRSRYKITAITTVYRPEEIKAIIGTCDIFFGARMHANIAALSSNVPTLAVAYSHKSLGIMSLYQLEQFVIELEELSPEVVVDRLRTLVRYRASISSNMDKTTEQLRRSALHNIELLEDVIHDIVQPTT